jgi:hypothetical protein
MGGRYGSANSPYYGMPMCDIVDVKRARRMADIDRLDPEMRALVHDYGYTVVKTISDLGVKKPKQIKHIVETVLNEFSPTRGAYSQQGIRTIQDEDLFREKTGK